jgi:uncharacterized membrane protein YgcG
MTPSRHGPTRLFRLLPAFVLGLFMAFLAAGTVRPDERILSYHSDITVREPGDLIVEETIRVRAEGAEIRRGIFRDFPTRYRSNGYRYTTGFDVVEVLRDGEPEPFHIKNQSNGKRVYVGSESVFLDPGEYTYTIRYTTTRQIGFFGDHDELYWNVTGNGWAFPIDQASADIHLPEAATDRIGETDAYTGPQGSRGKAFRASLVSGNTVHFETTEPLGPAEGLTIVVSWPKGIVIEPTKTERTWSQIRDNPGTVIGLIGIVLVLCYFLYFWAKVGKDPAKGTIFPQFKPPTDLSPAAARYVSRMGYDNQTFASAVVDMAVKGFLTIEEGKEGYTLHRAGGSPDALSAEERKIAGTLFAGRQSIELKNTNHEIMQSAVSGVKKALEARFNKTYFFNNIGYFLPGLGLSLLVLVASVFVRPQAETYFLMLWLSIWTLGCTFLAIRVVSLWRQALSGARPRAVNIGAAVFMTFFSLPFFTGEGFALFALSRTTSLSMPAIAAGLAVLNMLFYRLLKAPTLQGRKAMDALDGFRMYLSAAEAPRLKILHPPDRTPKLFEAFLPYALALGVEQQWAEQFSDVLARAGESRQGYTPTWYSGTNWSGFQANSFASSIGGSLSSAISSASTAPGSSSGGGGGGSSGGGGGGGGGGGW